MLAEAKPSPRPLPFRMKADEASQGAPSHLSASASSFLGASNGFTDASNGLPGAHAWLPGPAAPAPVAGMSGLDATSGWPGMASTPYGALPSAGLPLPTEAYTQGYGAAQALGMPPPAWGPGAIGAPVDAALLSGAGMLPGANGIELAAMSHLGGAAAFLGAGGWPQTLQPAAGGSMPLFAESSLLASSPGGSSLASQVAAGAAGLGPATLSSDSVTLEAPAAQGLPLAGTSPPVSGPVGSADFTQAAAQAFAGRGANVGLGRFCVRFSLFHRSWNARTDTF